MSSLDRQALAWLHDHHATISSEALEASGLGLHQRKDLVRDGVLGRVVDGAYSIAGVDQDELSRAAALCTSRPHLVVAGPTAARLWDLRRAQRDGLVHVLAPPSSHPCREPWVRAYRTPLIFDDEIVVRDDGIRLTSPPRTLVDMTRYVGTDAIASMIEHALSRQLCTVTTMHRTASRQATPGRPWARRFLGVLAQRHPGAAADSEGEMRVFAALLARGLRGLQRQVGALLPGYGPARYDIADEELRWAVEVDLHPEHETHEGIARDNVRDEAADSIGWDTHRIRRLEYDTNFDTTILRLVASHERRRRQVDALRAAGAWPPR